MATDVPSLRWKFAELLDKYGLTAYRIVKEIDNVGSMGAIYKLADESRQPARADFKTMAKILTRAATGSDIPVGQEGDLSV
jgi:hypothetical protein